MAPRGVRMTWNLRCVFWALMIAVIVAVVIGIANLIFAIGLSESAMTPPAPPPATVANETLAPCVWCPGLLARFGLLNIPNSASTADPLTASMSMACYHLNQSHFDEGTVIVEEDGACIVLDEDIEFKPRPDLDFRATDEPYASDPAFVLDFMAGILVRADDVLIDLNGHRISQSIEHRIKQRFWAAIELGSAFIATQGPADFVGGPTFRPGTNVRIVSGTLGPSSHHGIHGNNAVGLLVKNVVFENCEIASIALNAPRDVVISSVDIRGGARDVPVNSVFSSWRFMRPFTQTMLAAPGANGSPWHARLHAAVETLDGLEADVMTDVAVLGKPTVDAATHQAAFKVFGNPSGLIDGNQYGIMINRKGVAVNGFPCDSTPAADDAARNILIEKTTITDVIAAPREVIPLFDNDAGKPLRGPVGDVVRFGEIVNASTGAYDFNVITEAKAALGGLAAFLGVNAPHVGTLHISPKFLQWIDGNTSVLTEDVFSHPREGDSMFHYMKPVSAIVINNVPNVWIYDTHINGVTNMGSPSNKQPLHPFETEEAAYTDTHPAANVPLGAFGTDACGIAVIATRYVTLQMVSVYSVHSAMGHAKALAIFNDAKNTYTERVVIRNTTAFTDTTFSSMVMHAHRQPAAVGIYASDDSETIDTRGPIDIDDTVCGAFGQAYQEVREATGHTSCIPTDQNFYA